MHSLEEQRAQIRKKYKHGARARRDLVNFDSLGETEKAVKMETACFLKAAGFSSAYIGEAVGTTRGSVRHWFADFPSMRARVAEIQADYIDGAVKLLKTYAIELVEMLVDIARQDVDPKVRIQAITEALDRMGISKVNKSESAVTQTKEVNITDRTGLLAAMKEAPPHVQQEMAVKMEEMMALAAEHSDQDVTHDVA